MTITSAGTERLPVELGFLTPTDHLTRADAVRRGITDAQLHRWVKAGHLRRPHQGVYTLPAGGAQETADEAVPDRRPDATPWHLAREEHLRRAVMLLEMLPGSYLTGLSAALAHDLPVLFSPTGVEMSRLPYVSCSRPGVMMRRPWGAPPLVTEMAPSPTQGQQTSRLAQRVRVQPMAEVALDVAAHHGIPEGLVVADAACRRGVNAGALMTAARSFASRPGAQRARLVAERADPRSESPAESRARWIFETLGIAVVPQYDIYDDDGRFVARPDFVVAGTNVIVEIDGLLKYTDRDALRREKQREIALQRLGWFVVRLLYRDLDHPERVRALVREAVALATRGRQR